MIHKFDLKISDESGFKTTIAATSVEELTLRVRCFTVRSFNDKDIFVYSEYGGQFPPEVYQTRAITFGEDDYSPYTPTATYEWEIYSSELGYVKGKGRWYNFERAMIEAYL